MSTANTTITDTTPMPFGQYKNTPLANVPADYLLWLYRNEKAGKLKPYIQDNFEVLEKKVAKQAKKGGKKW